MAAIRNEHMLGDFRHRKLCAALVVIVVSIAAFQTS
jgi:hypothetical protein